MEKEFSAVGVDSANLQETLGEVERKDDITDDEEGWDLKQFHSATFIV